MNPLHRTAALCVASLACFRAGCARASQRLGLVRHDGDHGDRRRRHGVSLAESARRVHDARGGRAGRDGLGNRDPLDQRDQPLGHRARSRSTSAIGCASRATLPGGAPITSSSAIFCCRAGARSCSAARRAGRATRCAAASFCKRAKATARGRSSASSALGARAASTACCFPKPCKRTSISAAIR